MIWEEIPPLLDTPLHVHANQDELFHIVVGEHEFRCGEQPFRVGPGAFVYLPRGVPHAHRRLVLGRGLFLVITRPGGFEGFFRSSPRRAGRETSVLRRTPGHRLGSGSPGCRSRFRIEAVAPATTAGVLVRRWESSSKFALAGPSRALVSSKKVATLRSRARHDGGGEPGVLLALRFRGSIARGLSGWRRIVGTQDGSRERDESRGSCSSSSRSRPKWATRTGERA
ncbi:MAG: cupin domain-containing protein [Actinobacteria bacterium]|nr:cupin domain-containing protein [Actinomycetota bacterium]